MKTYTKVHELLADPARWCQGANALDSVGMCVSPFDEKAVRFCLNGAIQKVYYGTLFYADVVNRAYMAARARGYLTTADFNDNNDHATVLAFCKELDI